MDRQLIEYLPLILRNVSEYKTILNNGHQAELSELWDCIQSVFNDQFILDATENGIARWEKILEIHAKGTDSLENRKLAVLSRLNAGLPYTLKSLEKMFLSLCGQGNYTISCEIYQLTVRILSRIREKFNILQDLLDRVVPCNMLVDFSILLNSHKALSGVTHADLGKYTYFEVRNEDLIGG